MPTQFGQWRYLQKTRCGYLAHAAACTSTYITHITPLRVWNQHNPAIMSHLKPSPYSMQTPFYVQKLINAKHKHDKHASQASKPLQEAP
jgi:hypothetical protein